MGGCVTQDRLCSSCSSSPPLPHGPGCSRAGLRGHLLCSSGEPNSSLSRAAGGGSSSPAWPELSGQSILKGQAKEEQFLCCSSCKQNTFPWDTATIPWYQRAGQGFFLPGKEIWHSRRRASTQWSTPAARHPSSCIPSPAGSPGGHSSQMGEGAALQMKDRELN